MGPGGDLNCYNTREKQLLNGDLKNYKKLTRKACAWDFVSKVKVGTC